MLQSAKLIGVGLAAIGLAGAYLNGRVFALQAKGFQFKSCRMY